MRGVNMFKCRICLLLVLVLTQIVSFECASISNILKGPYYDERDSETFCNVMKVMNEPYPNEGEQTKKNSTEELSDWAEFLKDKICERIMEETERRESEEKEAEEEREIVSGCPRMERFSSPSKRYDSPNEIKNALTGYADCDTLVTSVLAHKCGCTDSDTKKSSRSNSGNCGNNSEHRSFTKGSSGCVKKCVESCESGVERASKDDNQDGKKDTKTDGGADDKEGNIDGKKRANKGNEEDEKDGSDRKGHSDEKNPSDKKESNGKQGAPLHSTSNTQVHSQPDAKNGKSAKDESNIVQPATSADGNKPVENTNPSSSSGNGLNNPTGTSGNSSLSPHNETQPKSNLASNNETVPGSKIASGSETSPTDKKSLGVSDKSGIQQPTGGTQPDKNGGVSNGTQPAVNNSTNNGNQTSPVSQSLNNGTDPSLNNTLAGNATHPVNNGTSVSPKDSVNPVSPKKPSTESASQPEGDDKAPKKPESSNEEPTEDEDGDGANSESADCKDKDATLLQRYLGSVGYKPYTKESIEDLFSPKITSMKATYPRNEDPKPPVFSNEMPEDILVTADSLGNDYTTIDTTVGKYKISYRRLSDDEIRSGVVENAKNRVVYGAGEYEVIVNNGASGMSTLVEESRLRDIIDLASGSRGLTKMVASDSTYLLANIDDKVYITPERVYCPYISKLRFDGDYNSVGVDCGGKLYTCPVAKGIEGYVRMFQEHDGFQLLFQSEERQYTTFPFGIWKNSGSISFLGGPMVLSKGTLHNSLDSIRVISQANLVMGKYSRDPALRVTGFRLSKESISLIVTLARRGIIGIAYKSGTLPDQWYPMKVDSKYELSISTRRRLDEETMDLFEYDGRTGLGGRSVNEIVVNSNPYECTFVGVETLRTLAETISRAAYLPEISLSENGILMDYINDYIVTDRVFLNQPEWNVEFYGCCETAIINLGKFKYFYGFSGKYAFYEYLLRNRGCMITLKSLNGARPIILYKIFPTSSVIWMAGPDTSQKNALFDVYLDTDSMVLNGKPEADNGYPISFTVDQNTLEFLEYFRKLGLLDFGVGSYKAAPPSIDKKEVVWSHLKSRLFEDKTNITLIWRKLEPSEINNEYSLDFRGAKMTGSGDYEVKINDPSADTPGIRLSLKEVESLKEVVAHGDVLQSADPSIGNALVDTTVGCLITGREIIRCSPIEVVFDGNTHSANIVFRGMNNIMSWNVKDAKMYHILVGYTMAPFTLQFATLRVDNEVRHPSEMPVSKEQDSGVDLDSEDIDNFDDDEDTVKTPTTSIVNVGDQDMFVMYRKIAHGPIHFKGGNFTKDGKLANSLVDLKMVMDTRMVSARYEADTAKGVCISLTDESFNLLGMLNDKYGLKLNVY